MSSRAEELEATIARNAWWPGRHVYYNINGTRVSLSVLAEVARARRLWSMVCESCGSSIEPVIRVYPNGRKRGCRTDQRYCTRACRQRAYRQRIRTSRLAVTQEDAGHEYRGDQSVSRNGVADA